MKLSADQIAKLKRKSEDGEIKILIYDLETSPMQAWIWGLGEQYVGHNQIVEGSETKIITVQYKYAAQHHTSVLSWDWTKSGGGNDERLLKKFVKIFNDADLVVGQNSKAFDYKILQWRLNRLNLEPAQEPLMLDILTMSRKSFRTATHKLDYRSKMYGFGGKIKMDLDNWVRVVNGEKNALDEMCTYGLKDGDDTDAILWKEIPYYEFSGAQIKKIEKLIADPFEPCRDCKQKKLKSTDIGFFKTATGATTLHCNNCGNEWGFKQEKKACR